jgi:hypothetical protein
MSLVVKPHSTCGVLVFVRTSVRSHGTAIEMTHSIDYIAVN